MDWKSKSRRRLEALSVAVVLLAGLAAAQSGNEQEAAAYMNHLDVQYSEESNKEVSAWWEFATDTQNKEALSAAKATWRYQQFQRDAGENCSYYQYQLFQDDQLYRRYRFLTDQGPAILPLQDFEQYDNLQSKLMETYGTATICDFYDRSKCDLNLSDVESIMASSVNFEELQYVWEEWRAATGAKMRQDYLSFVQLSNKAAKLNGFQDTADSWLNPYTVTERESDYSGAPLLDQQEFRQIVESIWNNASTIYKKLHAFVRYRLSEVYPDEIDLSGPIPANVLGNLWADDWTEVASLVMPFPEYPSYDVTDSMRDKGWDIKKMVDTSEDFFASLGMEPMSKSFLEKSIFNQTAWGKEMVCDPAAVDFCLGNASDDWRIRMCAEVDMDDLVKIHELMGQVEYFMEYKDQPLVFRQSANPGLLDAVGGTMGLSVLTPLHMQNVLGLSPWKQAWTQSKPHTDYPDDVKKDLNFLMRVALEKIAFLPYGYLMDAFRWALFEGQITEKDLNQAWWQLRESVQGIVPPGDTRGEEFFDAGAKFEVLAHQPYIRYFVSDVAQFQIHQHLCDVSGNNALPHACDNYGSKPAGSVLKEALSLGFSQPWPVTLKKLSGSDFLDPQGMEYYFQELIQFIDQELENAHECVGWGDDCTYYTKLASKRSQRREDKEELPAEGVWLQGLSSPEVFMYEVPPTNGTDPDDEQDAEEALDMMADQMAPLLRDAISGSWKAELDYTDKNVDSAVSILVSYHEKYMENWKDIIDFYNYEGFNDSTLQRRFEVQEYPYLSALNSDNLTSLYGNLSAMNMFTFNKTCPHNNQGCDVDKDGLSLYEVEWIMETSRHSDELSYYWKQLRENIGKPLKSHFLDYVDMLNAAAMQPDNSFKDAGRMWQQPYETPDYSADEFVADMDRLMSNITDLYERLHAYVRYRIRAHGPYADTFGTDSPIPAHILGDMYGSTWENIYDLVAPYTEEEAKLVNITEALQQLKVKDDMLLLAESFYTNTGLYSLDGTNYYKGSKLGPDDDGDNFVCKASSWNFFDSPPNDFRLKMCLNITEEDFMRLHHEMGKTQYQIAFSYDDGMMGKAETPLIFREGANPGFTEAIGDTIALSVATQTYQSKLYSNLTGNSSIITNRNDTELQHLTVNQLMKTALQKLPFITYSYVLEKFRYEVFAGNVSSSQLNYKWWDLKVKYMGVKPPVLRERDTDFDPGIFYPIANNIPYIGYFAAQFLQFQFQARLCSEIGQYGNITTLSQCNIYGHQEAGAAFKELLKLGRSADWTEQLEDFLGTGKNRIAVADLIGYFEPLSKFLDEQVDKHNYHVGWSDDATKYFYEHIPATVPIVVGIVLVIMIGIVVVAYFYGKSRQDKKNKKAEEAAAEAPPIVSVIAEAKAGTSNEAFELNEKKKDDDLDSLQSVSSGGSDHKM